MYKKFRIVLLTFLTLCLLTVFLFMDNLGIQYEVAEQELTFLPDSVIAQKDEIADTPKTCLFLYDSRQENQKLNSKKE